MQKPTRHRSRVCVYTDHDQTGNACSVVLTLNSFSLPTNPAFFKNKYQFVVKRMHIRDSVYRIYKLSNYLNKHEIVDDKRGR